MAFSQTAMPGDLDRKWSWGPIKIELQQVSCSSSDTSGTVNAKHLSRVDSCVVIGIPDQTSAPSISGTAVTLAFADPASACTGYVANTCNGLAILIGR